MSAIGDWREIDDTRIKVSRSLTVDQWTIEWGRRGRAAIAELEADNGRLKCCGNCQNHYWDGSAFECDFNPCGDDIADEPNDDVSPSADCSFHPSQWMRRGTA